MKRLLLIAALALSVTAAGARADDYSTVPGTFVLPSSEVPNGGSLALPPSWLAPPETPVQLSYDELLQLWRKAGDAYGVPWNVLASINKIESNFGRNMGPSSAGAIGWMQFMPSTWMRWGTDADADGIANPWNPVDAIYSAARYLAAAGAADDIRQAVWAYNHADWYVNDVMELAQLYGSSDTAPADAPTGGTAKQPPPPPSADDAVVFTLDRLQVRLEDAKNEVLRANAAYEAAIAHARDLVGREDTLEHEAQAAPLLSDRLLAQKDAVQVSIDASSAQTEADQLAGVLATARGRYEQLQGEARAASFNQPAAKVLSAPTTTTQGDSRYVFPVAGGPQTVSVSHHHHDYPAADIAAPEGAQLYALSDGVVLYSWPADERCGAGFTMKASDGQVWTYCHLSYLEPSVTAGAELSAGAPVGLVGSTGRSTGPHLHLQLQPASSYPQEQSWFQSFAGAAFRWQEDGETRAGATSAGPVFTIVEEPAG